MALQRLTAGNFIIEYDREATVAAYSRVTIPGPEECTCWYCKNWVAGRDRIVPMAVREMLDRLGIPLNGEIEVWEVPGETLSHGYGGWYMLVGAVVEMPAPGEGDFVLDDWKLGFSAKRSYEVPAFAGLKVCELHFFTQVPDFIELES